MINKDLQLIRDLTKKHHLTAFKINQFAAVATNTIKNLLDPNGKPPKEITISIVLDAILNKYGNQTGVNKEYTTASRNKDTKKEHESHINTDFTLLNDSDKFNLLLKIVSENHESLEQIQTFITNQTLQERLKKISSN